MLRHTFIHVPGVGRITEERLWGSGIKSWEECLSALGGIGQPPFSPRVLKVVESHLENSCRSLSRGDTAFFEEWIPSREKWRMYPDFANGAVFLDIETTGFSSW